MLEQYPHFLKEEDNLLIRCYDYTKVSTFLQIDFFKFLALSVKGSEV